MPFHWLIISLNYDLNKFRCWSSYDLLILIWQKQWNVPRITSFLMLISRLDTKTWYFFDSFFWKFSTDEFKPKVWNRFKSFFGPKTVLEPFFLRINVAWNSFSTILRVSSLTSPSSTSVFTQSVLSNSPLILTQIKLIWNISCTKKIKKCGEHRDVGRRKKESQPKRKISLINLRERRRKKTY